MTGSIGLDLFTLKEISAVSAANCSGLDLL